MAIARVLPSSVIEYSTVIGTVGVTLREISPSRSSPLTVCDNIFCETPPTVRRSSLNRRGCFQSAATTSTAHVLAILSRIRSMGHSASGWSGFTAVS